LSVIKAPLFKRAKWNENSFTGYEPKSKTLKQKRKASNKVGSNIELKQAVKCYWKHIKLKQAVK